MKKSDFFFELPPDLIAQTPLKSRELSRLLRMDKATGAIEHKRFYELPGLLRSGDCLVLNNSRVMLARLIGKQKAKQGDDSAMPSSHCQRDTASVKDSIEVVLLKKVNRTQVEHLWECLTKPGRKMKVGANVTFGDGELTATVREVPDNGNRLIEFFCEGVFSEVLDRLGKMPLPPYIHEELEDSERYQTVYSKEAGSAAAPTAGLHFTEEILSEIKSVGVDIQFVTLHVGLGTFRPVKTENIEDHDMHAEYYILSEETANAINKTKERGGRVIAVGTTSCRVLESCSDDTGEVSASSGFTDIFIYPGYSFKCIDGLITNFHLPESTLIMLVSALAGKENTLHAYNEAIRERYRFYSFGDAMLIL